jgi:hypothetical protein
MWHVDPLLGNDSNISNYTRTVIRQRPVNSNRGTMCSVRSVSICYKQGQLAVGAGDRTARFSRCELLLSETGRQAGDSSGTHRLRGTSAAEAATKQRQL